MFDDLSGDDPNNSDWDDCEQNLSDNDDIVDRDVAPVNVELNDIENHRNGENAFIPRRSARLMLKNAHPQGNVSRVVDRREEKMIPNTVKEAVRKVHNQLGRGYENSAGEFKGSKHVVVVFCIARQG